MSVLFFFLDKSLEICYKLYICYCTFYIDRFFYITTEQGYPHPLSFLYPAYLKYFTNCFNRQLSNFLKNKIQISQNRPTNFKITTKY